MKKLLYISVFVILLQSAITIAGDTDYKVVILHPTGFDSSGCWGVSGGQQVGYGYPTGASPFEVHALLWSGTAESVVDLHPSGFIGSYATGISGGKQVGVGENSVMNGANHALLWSGTADSVVDLHPSGFLSSYTEGISGDCQIGYGHIAGTETHALLWTGTPDSVVDLHPTGGFIRSYGIAISGSQQVGFSNSDSGISHALLWLGTADSVVDLHPTSGFISSEAYGISGNQQVGYGYVTGSEWHALLWSRTSESVVDLHPLTGFSRTFAVGTSGGQQVGYGDTTDIGRHALLWSGTAESYLDLHTFLPVVYTESTAEEIDSNGNIIGYAYDGNTRHAVMWIPVIYVEIEIKPGSYPNSINLGNEGVIPVAILSSWEFDATTVDPTTVELAGAGVELRGKSDKAMAHKEDVNNDGLIDLVVQITTQNLDPGAFQDGYATLTGKTYDGTEIEGSDEINIVPK